MPTDPERGYLTIGIDTEIPWPDKERVIEFQGREFLFLPQTDKLQRAIRVKLEPGFPKSVADRMILELLSALAWAEQRGADTTFAIWGTVPVNVGKGPFGVIGGGRFDYLPNPPDRKAKLALAIYREALSVNLTPYKFLGFFKVVNVIRDSGDDQKDWIRANLRHLTDAQAKARLLALQSIHSDVADYLYRSGRNSVAHAYKLKKVVNPDDPEHLIRLSEDLPLIQDLARIAIECELNVRSIRDYHDDHLYELEGFRSLLGTAQVTRIKAGDSIPPFEVPVPKVLSVRVRDRDNVELFESMDALVLYVQGGCVRIRLGSRCHRLVTFATLHFASERFFFNGFAELHLWDNGSPEAARTVLQWMQFHRWYFGGNGTIELWDPISGKRLARAQPCLTVNMRFPHNEFEVMERKLRERVGISGPTDGAKSG